MRVLAIVGVLSVPSAGAGQERPDGGGVETELGSPAPEGEADRELEPVEAGPSTPPESAGSRHAGQAERVDDDAAWTLYHEAFAALAAGSHGVAARTLYELRRRHPGHQAAQRADTLLTTLLARRTQGTAPSRTPGALPPAYGSASGAVPAPPPSPNDPRVPEEPTGTARAELVLGQTLHGLALGFELCMARCESIQPWVLAAMVGGGVGFGLSLGLSEGGVTPGFARALNSGVEWGAWHGLMLALSTDYFGAGGSYGDDDDIQAMFGAMALGQLVGLGASALAYDLLRPTVGQVSLTSSGGLWTAVAAMLFMGLVEVEVGPGGAFFWTALLASDAGLLAGALLASEVPMSAGRVLLIDAGGLLGTLLGVGLPFLITGDKASEQAVFGVGLVGLVTGLALGYGLTTDWDDTETVGHADPRAARAAHW